MKLLDDFRINSLRKTRDLPSLNYIHGGFFLKLLKLRIVRQQRAVDSMWQCANPFHEVEDFCKEFVDTVAERKKAWKQKFVRSPTVAK